MSSTPEGNAGAGTRLKVHTLSFRAWALAGSVAVTLMEERFGRSLQALRVPEVEEVVAGLTDAERASLRAELTQVRMADDSGRLLECGRLSPRLVKRQSQPQTGPDQIRLGQRA